MLRWVEFSQVEFCYLKLFVVESMTHSINHGRGFAA